MKKNRMMRLASILLVAVLLSTSVISGTFAKYTSTSSDSDTARVAKWDIKLENETMVETFTFDLFNTTTADLNNVATSGSNADDVVIIAPGTSGSFEINLKNASEVNAEYTIAYTIVSNDDIPLQFSTDGTNWATDIATLNVTKVAINMGVDVPVVVRWRWAFEGTDAGAPAGQTNETDTDLGEAAVAADKKIEVKAVVTVDQVN